MMPAEPIPTVYVVDDDESIRESLSSLLRSVGMDVQTFDSPATFLQQADLSRHACVVLDVRMPGLDGLELQKRLADMGCELPVVFITGHGEVPLAVRAMRAGAVDFLNKPFSDMELLNAVHMSLAKQDERQSDLAKLEDLRKRFDSLTPRERQILEAVTLGKANKVIAIDLNVTESTVKVHRHNAMLKMHVRSVAELTRLMDRLKK